MLLHATTHARLRSHLRLQARAHLPQQLLGRTVCRRWRGGMGHCDNYENVKNGLLLRIILWFTPLFVDARRQERLQLP